MAKTLNMTFILDSGKKLTKSLPDPKADLTRANVEPVMQSAVDRQLFVRDTATAVDIDSAVIREVTETKLI